MLIVPGSRGVWGVAVRGRAVAETAVISVRGTAMPCLKYLVSESICPDE